MSEIRWIILRSRFPLGAPTEELGEIAAPDKATAEQRGTALYGAPVVAQSVASRNVSRREKVGPGRIVPRSPKPRDPDKYRVFAARKRDQAKQPPRRDGLLELGQDPMTPIDFSGRRGKKRGPDAA